MKIDADAIKSINGGVMQFAIIDDRVVLVPLLGFIHV